jgi:hypothetical protein
VANRSGGGELEIDAILRAQSRLILGMGRTSTSFISFLSKLFVRLFIHSLVLPLCDSS